MTFSHLREIRVYAVDGRTSEMQLIKLLLANSPVLERMLIDQRLLDLDTRLKVLKVFAEVSNYSRASPEAEVLFVNWMRYRFF